MGVEITLNYPPQHYEIWPQRAYQQSINPAGKLIIKEDGLGRRKFFTIAMIDVLRDLPLVLNVRSDGGVAGNVLMAPTSHLSALG